LPPGGVVSRLTLCINGEEREAAFGGRSQVREAYQKVAVQQRRDPVLVTIAGPDRVLMQCFPVPPDGGLMKVRIGITSPLQLVDRENGLHAWPQFLERNFSLAENLKRSIWIASRADLACAAEQLRPVKRKNGRTGLQGERTETEVAEPANILRVHRAQPALDMVWADGPGDSRIEQTLLALTSNAPQELVVVLDGSAMMNTDWAAIAEALETVRDNVELKVILASDISAERWIDLTAASRGDSLIKNLRDFTPIGGLDNLPALAHGWHLAAANPGNVLLWIHGPQPVLLGLPQLRALFVTHGAEDSVRRHERSHPLNRRLVEKIEEGGAWKRKVRCSPVSEEMRRGVAAVEGWRAPRTQ
jgi:hypothetical protein